LDTTTDLPENIQQSWHTQPKHQSQMSEEARRWILQDTEDRNQWDLLQGSLLESGHY
jgi:hypothetical protein